jgi:hypothetical protein
MTPRAETGDRGPDTGYRMPNAGDPSSPVPGIRPPVSVLHDAAFALLLAVLAGRCMIGELPFATSQLQFVSHELASGPPGHNATTGKDRAAQAIRYKADRGEVARMSFALAILVAAALWAAGGAFRERLAARHGTLAALVAAFAVAAAAAAWTASNRRAAVNAAVEHTSFLLAAFLAAQLCRDRRRLALLAAVLLALGAALAAKGLWQRTTEFPARIADFDANRAERLRDFGWSPDTPQARMVENRLRDTSITGFLALANPLGSLLLVLATAGAGLAMAKLRAARAEAGSDGRLSNPRRKPGSGLPLGRAAPRMEVPPLVVAGAATALLTLLVLVAVFLTRSRGALVGLAVSTLAFLAVVFLHRRLAAHWRKVALGVAAAFVLAAAATVAYGLAHDRLPSRTLTFRWHYWTASAEIVRAHPAFGAGGGNFATAYLQHRRTGAEEEVQSAHNLFADALAQYGLIAGGLFLAAILYMFVGAARPVPQPTDPGTANSRPRTGCWLLVPAAIAALLCRTFLSDARAEPHLLVLSALAPVAVFVGALATSTWGLRDLDDSAGDVLRAALGCGALGFFVNSMVAESPWIPSAATAFYLAAGAALAGRDAAFDDDARHHALPIAAPAAVLFAVLAIGMAAAVWLPVLNKTHDQEQMLARLQAGDVAGAAASAASAAAADKLDPLPAMDAAKLAATALLNPGVGPPPDAGRAPIDFALQAVNRDGRNFACRLLVADLLRSSPGADGAAWLADGAAYARHALALNPRDAHLHMAVAAMLAKSARAPNAPAELRKTVAAEVLRLAAEARRLNDALEAESVVRLRADELGALSDMEKWARPQS